jgi:hypothetical protein
MRNVLVIKPVREASRGIVQMLALCSIGQTDKSVKSSAYTFSLDNEMEAAAADLRFI